MARTRRTRASPSPRPTRSRSSNASSPPFSQRKKPHIIPEETPSTQTPEVSSSVSKENDTNVEVVSTAKQDSPEDSTEAEIEPANDLSRVVGAATVERRHTRSLTRSFDKEDKALSPARTTLNDVPKPDEVTTAAATTAATTAAATTKGKFADNTQRAEDRWALRYEELKTYRDQHGHCLVPSRDSGKLSTWVCEQRKQYKRWKTGRPSSMTLQRAKLLDELEFDWSPMSSGASTKKKRERFDKIWHLMLDELIEYKEQYGDCLVPGNFKDNPRLGDWVHRQRKEYKAMLRKDPTAMNKERKKKLDALGFDWAPMESKAAHNRRRELNQSKFQSLWDEKFKELEEFTEKYGKRPVPSGEEFKKLSNWIHLQRKEYKKYKAGEERTSMTEDRIKRLEGIGFQWAPMSTKGGHMKYRDSSRFQDIWNERFQELLEYKNKHGSCLVLRSDSNQRLASWVHVQRKEYKRRNDGLHNNMTDERTNKLIEVGFDWAPSKSGASRQIRGLKPNKHFEDIWMSRLKELKKYKKKHGHTCVPAGSPKHEQLASWVRVQRKERKKYIDGKHSAITEERMARLEELDFEWTPLSQENKDEAWNERFEEFAVFRAKYGDAQIGKRTRLGTWLRIQRSEYRRWKAGDPKTTMTEERAKRIDDLGFDWDPMDVLSGGGSGSGVTPEAVVAINTQSWEAWFAELESYNESNGTCDIPPDFENKPLLVWIDAQRRELKKKKDGLRSSLTDERMAKLEDIGFDFKEPASPSRPLKKRRLEKEDDMSEKEEWDLRLAELCSYKSAHGDCLVPENYENQKLASFVQKQRVEYRKWKDGISKSSMDEDRAANLNEIGFDWKYEDMDLKVAGKKKLLKANDEDKSSGSEGESDSSISKGDDEDTDSEDDDDSSVESEKSEDDHEWNSRLAELEAYKSAHGDCLVPEHCENQDLAAFVEKQREEHKKWKEGLRSSMTKKKASKLEALKFEWVRPASASVVKGKLDPAEQWELRWKELKQYKEVYGDCLVPKNFKANRALGAWVARQRTQYWRMKEKKPTTITKAQVRKLKQLQFAFIVPYSR